MITSTISFKNFKSKKENPLLVRKNLKTLVKENNEILKSYFVTTKETLLIILDNASIEKFSPKLLSSAINNIGCEVDNFTEKTNQKDKNDLIQSVLKPGYKLILNNKEEKILKKALVKVFEFEN